MQQQLGSLRITHIVDANRNVLEVMKLSPITYFRKPSYISNIEVATLSDASHCGRNETNGQTGIITGLKLECTNEVLFHSIMWSFHKQNKVSFSSFGAESLAAADADDRGCHVESILLSLFPTTAASHHLTVDSKSLFQTITTSHQTGDYRLRITVSRIRDSFESRELNIVRWIVGHVNVTDALTKLNSKMTIILSKMLNLGY